MLEVWASLFMLDGRGMWRGAILDDVLCLGESTRGRARWAYVKAPQTVSILTSKPPSLPQRTLQGWGTRLAAIHTLKVKIPILTAKNAVRMGHPFYRYFHNFILLRRIVTPGPDPAWRWLLSGSRRCWRRSPGCRACRISRPFRSSSGEWRS